MHISPLPTPNGKTFAQAINDILAGHRVARRKWTENAPVYMRDGVLKIYRNGQEHNLIVCEGDLRGTDWYVI